MIVVVWPYDTNSMNYISLFNEVAVSAYLYTSLMLTDYLDMPDANDASHARE